MAETGFVPEQRRVLPTILVPAFLSLLSVSIVNVALPAIETSLGAGTSGLQWVVSGYALAFGVLLVAAGRAGDLWGRGRLFIIGLALFGIGSLVSGFAPNITVLNLARAVMGIGSGLLTPQVSGIIQQFFQGELRGRAFGALGAAVGVSVAVGPVLGGVFITTLGAEWGWRWCFLINVPIAISGIVAALVFLPPSAWRRAHHDPGPPAEPARTRSGRQRVDFDPVGMLLLALGTFFIMVSFMEAHLGWWVWGLLVLGVALVIVWVRWEHRYRRLGRTPMVDMQLFRTRSFASGTLLATLYFLGYTSLWLLVAQYMQIGLGHDALVAGMIGLPAAFAGAITAPIVGRHVVRIGPAIVLWGLGVGVVGLLLSAAVVLLHGRGGVTEWWLLATLMLTGIGQGLVVSPNQTLTLAEVPLRYAGSAGGVLQTGQRIGTSVGIAVITTIAFGVASSAGWGVALAVGFAAIIAVAGVAMLVGAYDLVAIRRERGRAGTSSTP